MDTQPSVCIQADQPSLDALVGRLKSHLELPFIFHTGNFWLLFLPILINFQTVIQYTDFPAKWKYDTFLIQFFFNHTTVVTPYIPVHTKIKHFFPFHFRPDSACSPWRGHSNTKGVSNYYSAKGYWCLTIISGPISSHHAWISSRLWTLQECGSPTYNSSHHPWVTKWPRPLTTSSPSISSQHKQITGRQCTGYNQCFTTSVWTDKCPPWWGLLLPLHQFSHNRRFVPHKCIQTEHLPLCIW